jgi:hypothetical protein
MAKKPIRRSEIREVNYGEGRWALLEQSRKKAMHIMEALNEAHLETIVHGSIARGDVNKKSDIDIFVPCLASSFIIESSLERASISASRRMIVQATPTYAMKGHIEIDDVASVSFPLMNMRRIEREFYAFGGQATLRDLKDHVRVAGVDKRLMLIQPTGEGHMESTIVGHEEHVANLLRISVETVSDRVHTLIRRDEIGRTGIFVKRELSEDETFEMAMSHLANENPAVRRRLTSLS